MKVLLIHNKYKEPGGEDQVFSAERELLLRYGHEVEELIFNNNDIRTVIDKLLSGFKIIYNPLSARMLRGKIEEFNPDVIHVHNFVPLASPSIFLVAKKYNIPVVLTLHNYRLICPGYTLFHNNTIYEKSIGTVFPLDAILKGVYRNSCLQTGAIVMMTALHEMMGTWKNKVDVYVTLTQFARRKFEMSAISIPANKLVTKPNFIKDQGEGERIREDFFLFVGRLTEEKGIRTLLAATTLGNFKLVILGDGPLHALVADFAKANPNVSYMGFQDKVTVMRYMKTCRALIFPSLWYEGFPITILEALCTGTIVIASKLGGMAEIIEDHVNGLHFEAGNEKELVLRIEEVNGLPQYLEALSRTARLAYQNRYTPEHNYSMLLDIYNRALAVGLDRQNKLVYKPAASGR